MSRSPVEQNAAREAPGRARTEAKAPCRRRRAGKRSLARASFAVALALLAAGALAPGTASARRAASGSTRARHKHASVRHAGVGSVRPRHKHASVKRAGAGSPRSWRTARRGAQRSARAGGDRAPNPRPVLSAQDGTLRWTATAASHQYLQSQTVGGRTTYAVIVGTTDTPAAVSGATVTYQVRPRFQAQAWSNEVTITYAHTKHHTTEETTREREEREARERRERERAEREAKEKAEREAKEQAEREAKEKAEREAKEKAEREAKEKAEREAKEQAEREAKEKAEREQREREEREHESSGGATVGKAPLGPPAPSGGWSVAYADAFGAQLGTAAGQDNTWQAEDTPAGRKGCCNNSDEIAVMRPSQVSVTSEGLRIACEPLASPIEGQNYKCGGVSGALCCQITSSEPAGYHSPVITLGKEQTLAFQFHGRLTPNLAGGADPAWWMDGPPWSETEFDMFELWGWGKKVDWATSNGTYGCWFAPPHFCFEDYGLGAFTPQDEHTYTVEIYPVGGGRYRYASYIDGVKQIASSCGCGVSAEATPREPERLNLIITYGMRTKEGTPALTGREVEVVRDVAVYEDAPHAGVGIEDGGIAPGTTVK